MRDRCLLFNSLMGASGIIVVRIFRMNTYLMIGTQDQNVIQAFFPNSSNTAFSICDWVWGFKWRVDNMNTFRLEDRIKGFAKFPIIIMDQVT